MELASFLASWPWKIWNTIGLEAGPEGFGFVSGFFAVGDVEDELKELALFLVSWLWVLGVKDLELVQWALRLKLKELSLFLVSWS